KLASIDMLFFFSSRRRHTRLQGDWSSDVCSSDLSSTPSVTPGMTMSENKRSNGSGLAMIFRASAGPLASMVLYPSEFIWLMTDRSEERRVGKESRAWCAGDQSKKNVSNIITSDIG